MARPKELENGVKMNLFVEERTALNAKALDRRAKKKDAKSSISKVTGALIDKKAKQVGITDKERNDARRRKPRPSSSN